MGEGGFSEGKKKGENEGSRPTSVHLSGSTLVVPEAMHRDWSGEYCPPPSLSGHSLASDCCFGSSLSFPFSSSFSPTLPFSLSSSLSSSVVLFSFFTSQVPAVPWHHFLSNFPVVWGPSPWLLMSSR